MDIQLLDRELIIENSGPILANDSQQLFERFKKGREESKTTGWALPWSNKFASSISMKYYIHTIRVFIV